MADNNYSNDDDDTKAFEEWEQQQAEIAQQAAVYVELLEGYDKGKVAEIARQAAVYVKSDETHQEIVKALRARIVEEYRQRRQEEAVKRTSPMAGIPKPQEDSPPPNLPMGLQVGTEATAPGQDAPAAVQRAPAPAQGQEEAVKRSSPMAGIPKENQLHTLIDRTFEGVGRGGNKEVWAALKSKKFDTDNIIREVTGGHVHWISRHNNSKATPQKTVHNYLATLRNPK